MIIDQTLIRKEFKKWREGAPHLDVFSSQKDVLFCLCCALFNQNYPNEGSKFDSENGFRTWRKLNPRIQDHENSPAHLSLSICSMERVGTWVEQKWTN
jgi:hypothetical protein